MHVDIFDVSSKHVILSPVLFWGETAERRFFLSFSSLFLFSPSRLLSHTLH